MDESWEHMKTAIDEDGIAMVTINRIDKLNALNRAALREIDEIFRLLLEDRAVKGIILTGAGDKAFAAGADIRELNDLDEKSGREMALEGQAIFSRIESSPKPVIALVNGYALGGGAELALACHLRFATENAVFGFPEVKLGLIPGYGGTQRLTRLVGRGRAAEIILTGDYVKAGQAERIGLVNRVVKSSSPGEEVKTWMKKMIGNGPLALTAALRAVNASGGKEGFALEAKLFGELCGTEDVKEGTAAFMEKRSPKFTGR